MATKKEQKIIRETLCAFEENSKDFFCNAILHALIFKNTKKFSVSLIKVRLNKNLVNNFLTYQKINKKCYALMCLFLIL